MASAKTERYFEIDMLKGLACYLMLVGHALRARANDLGGLPAAAKIVLYAMDFSGPMFFIASGMNVLTFWDRNRDKPGFSISKFYLTSALILFAFGYTYNLSIWSISMGVPDIFQGVAVCTALIFLIERYRPKAWAYLVIAAAIYAVYLPYRLSLQPAIDVFRSSVATTEQPFAASIDARNFLMRDIPFWRRQLFAHFSLFPWAVFFAIGAAIYRTRSRTYEMALAGFFALLIAGSLLLKQAYFANTLELVFRGVPGYILQTGGGAGLIFLAMRHVYHGAGKSRFLAGLEFAGRESLLFLILHYFLIVMTFGINMNMYLRAAMILTGTVLLLPLFGKWRDRLARRRGFVKASLVILAAGFVLGSLFSVLPGGFVLGRLLAFCAAFAFAFVFGELRARLRARLTKTPAPKAAASAV